MVSPAVYEQHASSANKRPPEYILLESGCTLRDVMNAFKETPFETLEERLRLLVGPDFKKSSLCFICQGLLIGLCNIIKTWIKEFRQVTSNCLQVQWLSLVKQSHYFCANRVWRERSQNPMPVRLKQMLLMGMTYISLFSRNSLFLAAESYESKMNIHLSC